MFYQNIFDWQRLFFGLKYLKSLDVNVLSILSDVLILYGSETVVHNQIILEHMN